MPERKYTLSNIFIVLLTIVLFIMFMAFLTVTQPKKHGYYTVVPSETMLFNLERGNYSGVLEDRYINAGLSISADKNTAYKVPYAASDYYEAALIYYGYERAGKGADASGYKKTMESARKDLGKHEYLADKIDEFLSKR